MKIAINRLYLVPAAVVAIVILLAIVNTYLTSQSSITELSNSPSVNQIETSESVKPHTPINDVMSGTEDGLKSSSQSETQPAETSSWLIWIVLLLAMTTLVSVATSFYLYRWRGILLQNNKEMIVPEEWAKHLMLVTKTLQTFGGQVTEHLDSITHASNKGSENLRVMTDTFMEMQSALDDKDREIVRLKSGYDAHIFRRFIKRFASIHSEVELFLKENSDDQNLIFIKRLFENAFDECGLIRFSPDIGDDYRKAKGVADRPKTIPTAEQEEDFLISEVLEEGYRFDNESNDAEVIPATVAIYKFETIGEQ